MISESTVTADSHALPRLPSGCHWQETVGAVTQTLVPRSQGQPQAGPGMAHPSDDSERATAAAGAGVVSAPTPPTPLHDPPRPPRHTQCESIGRRRSNRDPEARVRYRT